MVTRYVCLGMQVTGEDFQIVYYDTPGVLRPNYKLQVQTHTHTTHVPNVHPCIPSAPFQGAEAFTPPPGLAILASLSPPPSPSCLDPTGGHDGVREGVAE